MRGAGAARLPVLLRRSGNSSPRGSRRRVSHLFAGDIGVPCLCRQSEIRGSTGVRTASRIRRRRTPHTPGLMRVSNFNDLTNRRLGPCDLALYSSVHTGSEVGVAPGGVEPQRADWPSSPRSGVGAVALARTASRWRATGRSWRMIRHCAHSACGPIANQLRDGCGM